MIHTSLRTLGSTKNMRRFTTTLALEKEKIGFNLAFLRRRNTYGTTISVGVTPPREEAKKWANSFRALVDSKYGQALYTSFLQQELSQENIEFWLAVDDYKISDQKQWSGKAEKIYSEFIQPDAPKEVNLDSMTKKILAGNLVSPTLQMFDEAQNHVQRMLEADSYYRFLQSEMYLRLVHSDPHFQDIGINYHMQSGENSNCPSQPQKYTPSV